MWAVYNVVDKVLVTVARYTGWYTVDTSTSGSMTGGLVQDIDHVVLPDISPLTTMVITAGYIKSNC